MLKVLDLPFFSTALLSPALLLCCPDESGQRGQSPMTRTTQMARL